MKKSTQIAESNSTISTTKPTYLTNREGLAPRGSENVTADDLVIPRLELVQSLSPCRKKNDPQYIPGCEEGQFYNNVTREIYGMSVMVVPVYYRKEWCLFKDRNAGGGFRGAFKSEYEAKLELTKLDEGDDCEVVEMAQHFCLLIRPTKEEGAKGAAMEEIVVSMSKSKLKVSKRWNSLIRLQLDDSFARVYELSSIMETNSKNQDYYNLSVKVAGYPNDLVYNAAEDLYSSIVAGSIKINREGDSTSETAEY